MLLGEDGALLGSATAEHAPFASPRTAWAEQTPADWWRASQDALRAVLSQTGLAADAISELEGAVIELNEILRLLEGDPEIEAPLVLRRAE